MKRQYKCPECGCETNESQCPICGEIFTFYNGEYLPNYCGDCGSDMRCSSLKGNDIGHSIIDENQA